MYSHIDKALYCTPSIFTHRVLRRAEVKLELSCVCVIYRLDFTTAGVISMTMYSCIAQCDASIHVSNRL